MNRTMILKISLVLWGVNLSLLAFISLSMIGVIGSNLNLYPLLSFTIIYLFNSLMLLDFSINDRIFYSTFFIVKRSLIYLFLSFILVWFSGYFFMIIDTLIGLFSILSLIVSGKKLFKNTIS